MFEHFDGRFFKPAQFIEYCKSLRKPGFVQFVVLHNTGTPNISQRPHGYNAKTILNLRDFYVNTQHWHGGPHLIVDQNGIWILNGLDFQGVHSPSWNHESWGVEMLGDFETDSFTTGPGAAIAANAVTALACLHMLAGLDSHTLRFHREDPETTHKDCPGKNVVKETMIQRVHDKIVLLKGGKP